ARFPARTNSGDMPRRGGQREVRTSDPPRPLGLLALPLGREVVPLLAVVELPALVSRADGDGSREECVDDADENGDEDQGPDRAPDGAVDVVAPSLRCSHALIVPYRVPGQVTLSPSRPPTSARRQGSQRAAPAGRTR